MMIARSASNLLLSLTILLFNSACSQSEKLISVDVVYEDFATETTQRIDCDNFEKAFEGAYRHRIDNELHVNKIAMFASRFMEDHRPLDVRGTLSLNYEKQQIKYCFDQFGYFERDGKIYRNKQLFKLLDEDIRFLGLHDLPLKGYIPDEETAIKAAEARWLPTYGKGIYNYRPFKAMLKDGTLWVVQGTLKEGKGGVPYIEIRKEDSKVMTISHGK